MRGYLDSPLPPPHTPVADLPLLAIDIETTGLDPRRDRVLSVGFVPVDGDRIVLAGARSMMVRHDTPRDDDGVGQSATLHGLTDDAVAAGEPVEVVLDQIFTALSGRVLLAHYTRIETAFLGAACHRIYGVRPPILAVDTLQLHHRILGGGIDMGFTADPPTSELRLWRARERYGLPRYPAHDAVVDALACAELYLAQTAELVERGVSTLRDLGTA